MMFFLLNGERVILFPFTKKETQKTLGKYLSVSLLPICKKILERLLFNKMFNFFIENKLILSKSGNSCINQLLSITHETYKSFDVGLEVRSVFFDISKAFDKV